MRPTFCLIPMNYDSPEPRLEDQMIVNSNWREISAPEPPLNAL